MRFSDYAASRLLMPAYRKLKRNPSARYVRHVERVNAMSLEEIRAHQLGRLRAVATHAVQQTDFYEDIFKRLGIRPETMTWEEFAELPVLTKKDIREHREAMTSRNMPRDRLRESATGGTTSSPVGFLTDWEAVHHRNSATIAFNKWLGFLPGMQAAYLWGARQDFEEETGLKQRLLNRMLYRREMLFVEGFDDEAMQGYYERLSRVSPVLLQAYSTPLFLFSGFLLDHGLRLSIPAVSSTAEPLLPRQREVVEEAFGVRVYDWYGAREAGRIATECSEHNGRHINAYGLHVETVDCGLEGGLGEILISDLWNIGTPMLRYAIKDVGRLEEIPCTCGCALPRLVEVVGRTADTFINRAGRMMPSVVLTNRILKDDRLIREMQVIQEDFDRFRIRVAPGEDFNNEEEARRTLSVWLDHFMEQQNEIVLELVNSIPREASGKTVFCRRTFDPAPNGERVRKEP